MPNHKDKAYTIIMTIGALINLTINYILILKLKSIGVAIGTLISEILVCLAQIIYTRNKVNHLKYFKKIKFYLFPSIVMMSTIIIFDINSPSTITMLVLEILTGGVIYFLISLIIFYREENNIIIDYINKIKKKVLC